jgi:hypothetical protein
MFEDPAVRDAIGPTPLIDDVEWIVAEARECQEFSHPEASWNEGVHFPLLHKAVYGPRRKRQRVGVGNWYASPSMSISLKLTAVVQLRN